MTTDLSQHLICLHPAQLLALERVQGWSILCLGGTLLLTGLAPVGERQLNPGQSQILGSGLQLLESRSGAQLCLRPPPISPATGGWRRLCSMLRPGPNWRIRETAAKDGRIIW